VPKYDVLAERAHLKHTTALLAMAGMLFGISSAEAHFQEILPTTDRFGADSGNLGIDLVFTHPMSRGPTMTMPSPTRFGVVGPQGEVNLLPSLTEKPVDGMMAWTAQYEPAEPGDYVFFVEPRPYWEPAEGKSIIHYSKVVVDAYDWGGDWDRMVGLPVEIEPLVRPYGLWTGNLFSGIVRHNGEPVPFAKIEVEWVNDGSLTPPSDAFNTQVIKADGNGVFHYAMPHSGWWGFAALIEADYKLPAPNGTPQPVELGGLIWVQALDMN
jgi:cobalt/nickel transport protein